MIELEYSSGAAIKPMSRASHWQSAVSALNFNNALLKSDETLEHIVTKEDDQVLGMRLLMPSTPGESPEIARQHENRHREVKAKLRIGSTYSNFSSHTL
jgi:hypothetical protein